MNIPSICQVLIRLLGAALFTVLVGTTSAARAESEPIQLTSAAAGDAGGVTVTDAAAPVSDSGVQATIDAGSLKVASAADSDLGARTFADRCAGCHTIGGGVLTGPDLLAIQQWERKRLEPVIRTMERNVGALSNDDVRNLADLLLDANAKDRVRVSQKALQAAHAVHLSPPSAAEGNDLFYGRRALQNSGLPCNACHRARKRGGSLGPDLSSIARRMDSVTLSSAIESSGFRVMRGAYREHKVTAQEAAHIAAYLASIKDAPNSVVSGWLTWAGLGAGLFGFGAVGLTIGRTSLGARKRLLRRTSNR